MKITKIARALLAGVVSLQCAFSYAQGSRVDGIGEAQAVVAREHLTAIQQQLAILDESLARTATAIAQRERGSSSAAAAVAAGVGVGASIATVSGREVIVVLGMLFSLVATAVSIGSGAVGEALKSEAPTDKMEIQVAQTRKALTDAAAKTSDQKSLAVYYQLSNSLNDLENALQMNRQEDSKNTRNRIVATAVQTAGFFTLGFGLTPKGLDIGYLVPTGLGLMAIGNIGRFTSGLSDSQAKATILEIQKTRQMIADASAALAN